MEYKTKVAIVYVVGLFMEIMDTTIVNVALPTLARDFGVGTDRIEWVVLGYLLSLAVWIPASGWLGDRFGTKRVFLFALTTFTSASALCGLAGSLDQLIAFRVLQGVGGGMLTPVGAAMLYRAYPLAERARAATAVIGVAVVAPATGPVLGGLIVDTISWRWIFYVNVPLGLTAVVAGAVLLREHREPTAGSFDLAGFLTSAAALTLTVYGLSEGPRRGWTDPVVVTALAVALVAGIVLVWVETHRSAPMLDLSLLGERLFRQSNLVGVATYGGFVGLLFVFPLYLQSLRGFSALDSGLTQIPQAIGVMLSS
ncbi:MAG: DHA2 family efflux MFS transporter permease subunit, partial [Actinomyces sp.]